eukprot:52926-Amphidinium_carterae.1
MVPHGRLMHPQGSRHLRGVEPMAFGTSSPVAYHFPCQRNGFSKRGVKQQHCSAVYLLPVTTLSTNHPHTLVVTPFAQEVKDKRDSDSKWGQFDEDLSGSSPRSWRLCALSRP